MNDTQHKDLLRLVWGHRLFDTSQAELADGHIVEIVQPGYATEGDDRSGADFRGAVLRETADESVTLHGGVRIDSRASIWRESGEMSQSGADSVLLHVVGERDRVLMRGGREVRTLVLEVKDELKELYGRLIRDADHEPGERECVQFFSREIEGIEREQILARLMADRLRRKADEVSEIYRSLGEDWEQTAYVCFLRSLGMGEKKRSYEALARSLPYRCILRCNGDVQQIEALLMGQSGYLNTVSNAPDTYTRELQDIYLTLKKEHRLKRPVVMWGGKERAGEIDDNHTISVPVRPYSLPPAMLAQAAHLLGREPKLFSRIITCAESGGGLKDLRAIFRAGSSDYWNRQRTTSDRRSDQPASLSDRKIDLRVINFVIPLLSAKGRRDGNQELREWALGLYEGVAPEENTYTRQWSAGGFETQNAFDSQAVIQLATEYCGGSRCGECPVGILRMTRLWRDSTGF